MNKLILAFLVSILSSCTIYDIWSTPSIDVSIRDESYMWKILSSLFKGDYSFVPDNADFIGKTLSNNSIEITIFSTFGIGDHINDFIYDEEKGELIKDEEEVSIWIDSFILFSITDTLGRVNFLENNFELEFVRPFTSYQFIEIDFLEDSNSYDKEAVTAHFLVWQPHDLLYEDEFTGKTYIEFSLESILLDAYPYTIEVGISDSFYSNVLMIEDF